MVDETLSTGHNDQNLMESKIMTLRKNGFLLKVSSFLALAFLLVNLVPSFSYAQVQRQATVINVDGRVEYLQANKTDWKVARKGVVLNQNDAVRTTANATAILSIESVGQNSMIKVANNSELRISDLSLDEKSGVESTLLDLAIGNILIDTKTRSGSQFKVKTPTAIVGARGTSFRVKVY